MSDLDARPIVRRLAVEFHGDHAAASQKRFAQYVADEYGVEPLLADTFDGSAAVHWLGRGESTAIGWAEMCAHALEDCFTEVPDTPQPWGVQIKVLV